MSERPSLNHPDAPIELGKLIDDGFIITDHAGQILMTNGMAIRYLGENLVGRSLSDVVIASTIEDDLETCIQTKQPVELNASTPVDQRQKFRIRMRMIDENIVGLLIMDMTLQHNLEKVRRDFVANVSHELRSPLTSLLGFIETMQLTQEIDHETQKKFLGIMDEEAKRMTRLIDDLLSLSRVETEEHITPTDKIDIKNLVQSVIESVSNRAQKTSQSISFNNQISASEAAVMVYGEYDELVEVFHNLLDNAIKYGFEKTDIIVEMIKSDDDSITFNIINQGEGIQEKHIARLTERFYRADKSRSRQMGGTGLGLAIVKHIISRHRGHINIESELGGETCFSITLPVA